MMNNLWINSAYNSAKMQQSYLNFKQNNKLFNNKQKNPANPLQAEIQQFIDVQIGGKKPVDTKKLPIDEKMAKKLRQMEMFTERLEQEKKSMRLSNIDMQLKSGANLKQEDLEFLKEHNPELYREALNIKEQREQYKKELARCRTKEEVEKLQKTKTDIFMGRMKAVQQANLNSGEKIKELDKIKREMAGINAEYRDFKKTSKFKSLPENNRKTKKNQKPTAS